MAQLTTNRVRKENGEAAKTSLLMDQVVKGGGVIKALLDSSIKREVLCLWSPLKSALEQLLEVVINALQAAFWVAGGGRSFFAPNQPPSSLPAHFTWLFPYNVCSTSLHFYYSTFLQTTMLDLHSKSWKPLDREQKRSFFWDPSKGSLHCIVGWGAQTLLKLKCVSRQKSTIEIT